MSYSQNNPAWSSYTLGFGPGKIGPYGCFLTAFSNVCQRLGRDINPAQLNEIMKANKWFTHDLVNNHKVPALVYPNDIEWLGETHWDSPKPIAADMNYFNDANDPNIAYIVYIDAKPAAGVQSHFTAVVGKEGNDLIIDDSWDGKRKRLSAYGSPPVIIQAAYKFRRKAAPKPAINQPVVGGDPDMAHPTAAEVQQAYRSIPGREATQEDINFHVAKSSYKSMIQGFFAGNDTAAARIGGLQGQITELLQRPTAEAVQNVVNGEVTKAVGEAKKPLQDEIDRLKGQLATALAALPASGAAVNKNTPGGKSLRTLFQTVLAAAPIVAGVATIPEVQQFFSQPINLAAVMAVMVPVVTYIQNKLEEIRTKKEAGL